MTDIIFSFDTEDFTCCRAADGIYEAAETLREEGLRGCFCLVGLLARQLAAWGRTDVLDALKHHEIGYHSYGHTLHPTINEYTDLEDYRAAYNEFMRQETIGMADVRAVTGADTLWAVLPPGNNESYVAMYGYADLGIPVYPSGIIDTPRGAGMYFCNALSLYYVQCLETIVHRGLAADKAFIDSLAERDVAVIYNHPNRWVYNTFWDKVNFHSGVNHHPFGQWEEADPMTAAEREHFRSEVCRFLRALKADGRFRFRTYSDLVKERAGQPRFLHREDMPGLHRKLLETFYPLTEPVSVSIADIFQAAARFLRGDKLHACGRVFGFLDTPHAIAETTVVRAEDVRAAAAGVDLETFLPAAYTVGDVTLGPADFLFAMLGALEGREEITLTPRAQNIDLSAFGELANPKLNKWQMHPDFAAEHITKRLPLQAWTIRF